VLKNLSDQIGKEKLTEMLKKAVSQAAASPTSAVWGYRKVFSGLF